LIVFCGGHVLGWLGLCRYYAEWISAKERGASLVSWMERLKLVHYLGLPWKTYLGQGVHWTPKIDLRGSQNYYSAPSRPKKRKKFGRSGSRLLDYI